jgi:hypothetical protein
LPTATLHPARLIAIVALLVAVACSWIPAIQRLADGQVDAGLKRALASFAVAKTLNAAISAAQGTEVAVQPVGVGITLTVGQVLDPLNDLVEQFASLMLAAAIAFGVQKVLLAIGAHWAVSLAMTVVALAWAALHLRGRAPPWLWRLTLVLVVVRFALPVVTIGSDLAFQAFLARDYQQAQQALGGAAREAQKAEVSLGERGDKPGWWEEVKGMLSASKVMDKVRALQSMVDQATGHVVDLAVVFILQTIVIPLVLLWAMLKLAGATWPAAGGRDGGGPAVAVPRRA